MNLPSATIAAIATPLGEGGLAVIRISGPEALAVAQACWRGKSSLREAPTHTVHYGHIQSAKGEVVDEVLATVLRSPRTFTREDTVEISCHGGIVTTRQVLEAILSAGAVLAEPGEFTRRAFLNGRIDLAQAEAVADLIHARTELAARAANEQLAGKLSARINTVRDDLLNLLAHVEAHIDFPDEDIEPQTQQKMIERMRAGIHFLETLLSTAREGQILRKGIRVAIVGRPNVGKSSLLNQLLGHDRAIVSPIPGTTRDTIEETASIRGIPVVFVDTAGLRESADPIEQEGIRRSRVSLDRADLVIQVLDGSEPLTTEDQSLLQEFQGRKRILVVNKQDLKQVWDMQSLNTASHPAVAISSTAGQGLETLKDTIRDLVWGGAIHAEMLEVMINTRHQDALRRTLEALQHAETALSQSLTLELVAMELRIAVGAVGEIVGKTSTEDLLDSIFSTFCLGK